MILTEMNSIIIIVHRIPVGKVKKTHFEHACPLEDIPRDWLLSQLLCQVPAKLSNIKSFFLNFNQSFPELRCSLAREPRVFKPSYTLSLIYIYTLPLVKRSQPTSSQHHHHRTQTTPRIPQSLKKIPCHDAIPSIFSNSNDTELSARAPLPILSQKKSTRNPASCSE